VRAVSVVVPDVRGAPARRRVLEAGRKGVVATVSALCRKPPVSCRVEARRLDRDSSPGVASCPGQG
jgi:hypothetical protein